MDINSMITLKDGQNYLLTQKTEYNGAKYFLAVGCNDKGILQKKYGVIREVIENGKTFAEFVQDSEKETKRAVLELFAIDFAKEVERDAKFLQVGQIVGMNGRDFALLDFIPMYGNLYGIFMTITKPLEIKVCKRGVTAKGEEQFFDVTNRDEGVLALQIHSLIHSTDDEGEEE